MENALWHPDRSRRITKRIVVTGSLVLQTPASFSTGDRDDVVDIPLLTDAFDPARPLLTGASLAGALRAYLAAHEPDAQAERHVERLFGGRQSDADGEQSPLIVYDALGESAPGSNAEIELRHGVRINPQSRTAEEGALYDRALWAAGTRFPLRLELVIGGMRPGKSRALRPPAELQAYEADLKSALATALQGLEQEKIALGGRKTRGCGRSRVTEWTVQTYDMSCLADLQAWIMGDTPAGVQTDAEIARLLGEPIPDKSGHFTLRARFLLDGSLLVRTEGATQEEPDMVHQRARQADGKLRSILAGTSLAGALRARSQRIAHTLGLDARALIDEVYGADIARRDSERKAGKRPAPVHASRLTVSEQSIIGGEQDLVQPRVSLDRFTGGALGTALFSEQPVFSSGGQATMQITLRLKRPEKAHIGLLLLTLKDLWTHDLPVGGESGVGRGRWLGDWAEMEYHEPHSDAAPQSWTIRRAGEGRAAGLELPPNAADLEVFVRALQERRPAQDEPTSDQDEQFRDIQEGGRP